VRKKEPGKSAANRARNVTSNETATFFPRAKYSYEKRNKETGLAWRIFEKQM
jgi:hypothetical protein